MFNFILLSLIIITFSSSNYEFKTINNFYDKNNDTFINYIEQNEKKF